MASGKLMEGWTFQRTLPEPFKDYSDNAVFKNIASKYCTQPQKRSTLHAATLQAVLTYMELEESMSGKPAEEAEYPSRTGELHVVVYNPANGKFTAGKYTTPPDTETGSLPPGNTQRRRIRKTHRENMYSRIPRTPGQRCSSP